MKQEKITATAASRMLEFLINQENTSKLTPIYIYEICKKIIEDTKGFANKVPNVLEKNKLDLLINQVLNKIPAEQTLLSQNFFDTLNFFHENTLDKPNYF